MTRNREGELYKIIRISDLEFEIRYGYYEESDRYSKYNDPIPIFPDFIKNPVYTHDGYLVVTHMQDKCEYYKGKDKIDECYGCKYYEDGIDLIGICKFKLKNKFNKE
jgi:hypothetical protein